LKAFDSFTAIRVESPALPFTIEDRLALVINSFFAPSEMLIPRGSK
jgi:hypothetical protein